MRKTPTILILIVLLSCQTNDKPKGVLTKEELSAFLVDVYLAEAKLDAIPKVKDSTIRYFLPFEEKLLKQRGVSDSVLKITYSYYVAHPKELELIYDSVIDSLALREQRVGKIPLRPVVKPGEKPKLIH